MGRYKIVVLLKPDGFSHTTLKSTISLAKMIQGDIEVFSVKNPSEVVDRVNQHSAVRTIYQERLVLDRKLKSLVKPLSNEYDIPINHSFAIGNVKNEIRDFVAKQKPDIIVLGKRKERLLDFVGDKITQFVLDTFKGSIMIAAEKNALEPNKQISLGMLNTEAAVTDLQFAEDLMNHMRAPLKSFKIVKNNRALDKVSEPATEKKVEYVFEQGDGAFRGLAKYLTKNNIDLLYIDRAKKQSDKYMNLMKSDIRDLLNTLNVTLLVTGEQHKTGVLTN